MRKIELWKIAACLAAVFVIFAGCGRDEEVEVTETEFEEETVGEPAAQTEEEAVEEPVAEVEEETAGELPAEVGAVESRTRPKREAPPPPAPPRPQTEASPPPGSAAKAPEETPPPAAGKQPEPEPEEAVPVPPAPAPPPAAEAAGQQVFVAQRCGTCHSVSTAGIKAKVTSGATAGGDLAGVGKRRDRAAIAAIVRQQETVDDKKHPKRFTGSQEELDALIDWLSSQG